MLFLRARFSGAGDREENIMFFLETAIFQRTCREIFLLARIASDSGFQQFVNFIYIIQTVINMEGNIGYNTELRPDFLTEIKSDL